MNSGTTPPSTSNDNTFSNDDALQRGNGSAVGGFTYGLGVSLGILVLITTITVTSYFCTRETDSSSTSPPEGQRVDNQHVINIDGIDEATLKSYPKCLYSQLEKKYKGVVTQNSCSVCLGDYKGSDIVRELPECGHVFHVKCVDPWLRLHPTCPLCRTSPLVTPLSTPLVEVIPLASNLRGG